MKPSVRLAWLAAGILQLPWLLLLPISLIAWTVGMESARSAPFVGALTRSLGFGVMSAVVSILLGLFLGWFCRNLRGKTVNFVFPFLLMPVLIGHEAVGFFAKVAVTDLPFLVGLIRAREVLPTSLFFLGLFVFQFAPMCCYLVWLRAQSIPPQLSDYARTARLSFAEEGADVFWPHCRALCQVLFVFIFLLVATESTVTELAIHPSVGTSTALLSHWLSEQYWIWFKANSNIAAVNLLAYGLLGASCFIALGLVASRFMTESISSTAKSRFIDGLGSFGGNWLPRVQHVIAWPVALVLTASSLAPIVIAGIAFPPKPFAEASGLGFALLWSLPAAMLSVLVALSVAAMMRLSARRGLFLGLAPQACYMLAMNPIAIPAFVTSTAAFYWFGLSGKASTLSISGGWVLGQCLMGLPILAAFGFWLNSQINDRELEYQRLAGVRRLSLLRVSFFDRLKLGYLLTLLFGWSLIWNDGVINRAAAPDVPSLYALLAPRLSVRPDYRAAQFCLLLSVAVAALMVGLWQMLVSRSSISDEVR